MKAGIAVIGLGRFGSSVARTLTDLGRPVLAIDARRELVDEIAPDVESAVSLDTTDVDAMTELSLETFECVIVGIGESSLEASILTTALLSQMGVPRIIARAIHDLHARVLVSVGAHEVVNPEADIGARLARRMAFPTVLDQVRLAEDVTMAEIAAPERFAGRSLQELDMRNEYDVSVVAIRRQGKVLPTPKSTEVIERDDVLFVIGGSRTVNRIADLV